MVALVTCSMIIAIMAVALIKNTSNQNYMDAPLNRDTIIHKDRSESANPEKETISEAVTIIEDHQYQEYVNEEIPLNLRYPASYKRATINNAPHMLLKLEDNLCYFTLSYWDYNYDDSIDIWDDQIFENVMNGASFGGKQSLVSCRKTTLTIASGKKIKAIETVSTSNISSLNSNERLEIYNVYYYILHNGDLLLACYSDSGTYNQNDQRWNEILKGLSLAEQKTVGNKFN